MDINYLKNIKNIAARQTASEPQQQFEPTAEVDAGSGWPKSSVYDIDFKEFFRAANESTNNSIREAMEYMRVADAADAAEAAEAAFGGDRGHGVVEESQQAYEAFPDQF
jgi:hypothetical protein